MTRKRTIENIVSISNSEEEIKTKKTSNDEHNENNYLGIGPFSNEIELCVSDINAVDLIKSTTLPVMHETNRRDMLELVVSMDKNLAELNNNLSTLTSDLSKKVESMNGQLYGGSTVLEKVSDLKPKPASEDIDCVFGSAIKGFMNITSHQVVVGIKDEKIGWEIYNTSKYLSPLLIALTASSPYMHNQKGGLENTLNQSIRPLQYQKMFKYFPNSFWKETKDIRSIDELKLELEQVHNSILSYIELGRIPETKWDELRKERKDALGNKYTYEQKIRDSETAKVFFYWFVRPRLAHETISKGGDCVMSLEFRAPDTALNTGYMKNINRFVIGTCNYIANEGGDSIMKDLHIDKRDDVFCQMLECGKYGLNASINSEKAGLQIQKLGKYAIRGLELSNDHYNANLLTDFLEDVRINGNPADRMQKAFNNRTPSVNELKSYLIEELRR